MDRDSSPVGAEEPRRGLLDEVRAFAYVTAPKAPTYRAVVEVFYEAKLRYQVDLRPAQVWAGIKALARPVELNDEQDLERHLEQLCDWGVLSRSHDTASVARIEDFYRKRYLYMLTAVGEAAEKAVQEVEQTLGRSGALQANMLVVIEESLQALAAQAALGSPEAEACHKLLRALFDAFDSLTEEASRYLLDLDEQARRADGSAEGFALHKQAVLNYVGNFVGRLRDLGLSIQQHFKALASEALERLLESAVDWADLPPDEEARARSHWLQQQGQRFAGLKDWFVGTRPGESRLQHLADRAMLAMQELVRSLTRLSEARSQRSDRRSDFRTLARWFAACPDDEEAHHLWQEAFGMRPARLLQMAEQDPELSDHRSSWWDAEPAEVPLRLRSHGNLNRAGRSRRVPDYSDEQRWIEAQIRERDRVRERALKRFADRGPQALSGLGDLDMEEFRLLLEMLDRALSAEKTVRSADGALRIRLQARDGRACIRCPAGCLRCDDALLTVERVARQESRALRESSA